MEGSVAKREELWQKVGVGREERVMMEGGVGREEVVEMVDRERKGKVVCT